MKQGEKIIQIVKDDAYYLALTNQGNFYCLDVYLDGSSPQPKRYGHDSGIGNAVFISKVKTK